ncbi:MAG: hypothetical protein HYT93_01660 [Parcubacteria group bacterium]|nr:hypothetical protein [Parcubacteria group bacterium]
MRFKVVFGNVMGWLCLAYGGLLAVLGVAVELTYIPEVPMLLGVVTVDSFTANQRSIHLFLGMLLSFFLAIALFGIAYLSSEEERQEKEDANAP